MVSMRKMVQLSRWLLQLILLCQLWQLGTTVFGGPQNSCLGIYKAGIELPDKGDLIVLLLSVVIHYIGKKLDKGYTCPVYCGVDHIHRRKCTNEEQTHYKTTKELHRSTVSDDTEQSESYIRSERRIRIECTNPK